MPKVSIIVPIYNVEAFLPECLESIKNQTFKDWECLMFSDGSKD
ncbi:glycosyl transferase, partial [Bifidobacteriaceae bacterium NR003]